MLTALTALTVVAGNDTADAAVRALAAQPLPALQELKLRIYEPFHTAGELADYTAALPALKRVTVALRRSADTDRVMLASDRVYFDLTKERLSRAACAGVEICVEQHGVD